MKGGYMIKVFFFTSILILTACSTSTHDLRPLPVIQYEDTMRQGIHSYQRDDYVGAISSFKKALFLCQSIDDHRGILFVKINLIKSAQAINELELAEKNLTSIKDIKQIDPNINSQIILLQAQQFFLQKRYNKALKAIAPLISLLPEKANQYHTQQINLLLTQTKFAVFSDLANTKDWFEKSKTVISNNSIINNKQRALFKRLSAHITQKDKKYDLALELMQQAINSYKLKYNRRAIATCLEEKAAIYLAMKNITAAQKSLIRAKSIREWLQDTHKTQLLDEQLQLLGNEELKSPSELISNTP